MNSPMLKNRNPDGNPDKVSKLIPFECPCCHMLTWHNRIGKNVLCPFCSNATPGYLTKLSSETMRPKCRHQSMVPAKEEESPFINEFHMVQVLGFRCMAYRNGAGTWRGAFDDQELGGEVRVLD